jgi:hypothetical protein
MDKLIGDVLEESSHPRDWADVVSALLQAARHANWLASLARTEDDNDEFDTRVEISRRPTSAFPVIALAQGSQGDVICVFSQEEADRLVAKIRELRTQIPTERELYGDPDESAP